MSTGYLNRCDHSPSLFYNDDGKCMLCFGNLIMDIIDNIPNKPGLKPHLCPKCNGYGSYKREPGLPFDNLRNRDAEGYVIEPCNVCKGKGVLWG